MRDHINIVGIFKTSLCVLIAHVLKCLLLRIGDAAPVVSGCGRNMELGKPAYQDGLLRGDALDRYYEEEEAEG